MYLGAHTSLNGADFRVELTRHADFLLLRCGRLDSVRNTALHHDPHFTADASALATKQLPAAERRHTVQRLVALIEQYKVYRWDSLQVATSRYLSFVQLLDSVYGNSAAQLEQREANWGRIVLDGTLVHLVVRKGHVIEKDLYVHSPDSVSHPQLYRLLHGALQLYRQVHPAPMLDRRLTSGY